MQRKTEYYFISLWFDDRIKNQNTKFEKIKNIFRKFPLFLIWYSNFNFKKNVDYKYHKRKFSHYPVLSWFKSRFSISSSQNSLLVLKFWSESNRKSDINSRFSRQFTSKILKEAQTSLNENLKYFYKQKYLKAFFIVFQNKCYIEEANRLILA